MVPSFDEIFGQLGMESLRQQLEGIRKRQLRSYAWLYLAIGAGITFLVYAYVLLEGDIFTDYAWVWYLIAPILMPYGFYVRRRTLRKRYSKAYKEVMMPRMLEQLTKGARAAGLLSNEQRFHYLAKHGVDRDQLSKTKLFAFMKLDFLEGEDLISGNINDIQFQYSEIRAEEEYTDDEGKTKSIENFRGFAFLVDFHKNFQGTTIIESRGRSLRNYKMKLHKHRSLKDMSTVSVLFNKFYKVRTSDETLARYLLPVNMLEKLLELGKMFPKKKIAISLNDGLFALVIHRMDLFEIHGLGPISEKTLRRTYGELKVIMELVFTLGLNRRIWGTVNLNNLNSLHNLDKAE